ncbi:DUF7302 family protein [Stutzerimonas nitrititolerans]|uniref:DUF7302 family protein n=1 Tax=Stutzerimonas nitrititolerans TaxID=2482751 RepID=UPI0028A7C573|nr:hypothetical protein [Stutzerimonas nitrititolerans]
MKIKVLWGFIGNAQLLGAASSKVVAGQVFDKVDAEYGHALIGKGLAEEVANESRPNTSKPVAPKARKPAAPKEAKPAAPVQPELTPTDADVDADVDADPGADTDTDADADPDSAGGNA